MLFELPTEGRPKEALPEVARTFSRNLYPVFKEPAAPRGEPQTYTAGRPLSTPTPTRETPVGCRSLEAPADPAAGAELDYREPHRPCQAQSGAVRGGQRLQSSSPLCAA